MAANARNYPRFLVADNEDALVKKIAALQLGTHKEYGFLTIYPNKNKVYAWYYSADDFGTMVNMAQQLKEDKDA